MLKIKGFEHWSITVKISTSVLLLVTLTVIVSLVGLYGLVSMQKAVDIAGQASEVLLSVNTATERVEHFIASYDQDSLLTAKAIMEETIEMFTASVQTPPGETFTLTTGFRQFSKAIDILKKANGIMDAETSNMVTNLGRLREVSLEIEQNIEKRRERLNRRTARCNVEFAKILDAHHRILRIITNGERRATAIVGQRSSGDKGADLRVARDTCRALLPILDMLEGVVQEREWSANLNKLRASFSQAEQYIGQLIDLDIPLELSVAHGALQRLETANDTADRLSGMLNIKEESIIRSKDDLETEIGLLQNAANVSKRFAERVAKLEAQTQSFRLSPTAEVTQLIDEILDQLTRFARILPSAGAGHDAPSDFRVKDEIDGYRTAFDHFRQANRALRRAHDQVRHQAAQTASRVSHFANEQRAVAADNRERGILLIAISSVMVVLIALFIAWLTSRAIARPIVSLAKVMRRLADGYLADTIVGLHRGDELGTMARAVEIFRENAIQVRALEAKAEEERQRVMAQLENMVVDRTKALERKTRELEVQAEDLYNARVQAEAANRAKSVFLANMSHELRTPLNAILGYAQLLQGDAIPENQRLRKLEIINRSGEHLLTLINDVLEISRIEAGQLKITPGPFDLIGVLDDLQVMLQIEADKKRLGLDTVIEKNVPVCVVCDESKLRQILINLLGNALKFTEEGGIEMRVSAMGSGDDARLVVEVEDTGAGIPPEEAQKVFESFEQAQSSRRAQAGTGLGLAISREYAHLMGGDITFDSVVGKGSTFRLEVGIREANPADLPADERKRRVVGLAPGQKIPRVLIAEDNEESRTLLMTLLEKTGFEVRGASDGEEAVATFLEWRPRFIWMDIRMPVMDGLEATRRIKAMPDGDGVAIAALTAHALEDEHDLILAAGCDDFVRKPYRHHEIFEVMSRHLRVSYVYEEDKHAFAPHPRHGVTSEQLAATVPPELLDQLRWAVLRLNRTMVLDVVSKIKEQDPSLGADLESFADRFDFEKLLALLEIPASH